MLSLLLLSAENVQAAAGKDSPELSDGESPSMSARAAVTSVMDVSLPSSSPKYTFLGTIFDPKILRKLGHVYDAENRAVFLQNFSQIFNGTDGRRNCEQQALMNYNILSKLIDGESILPQSEEFLLAQMLVTSQRHYNPFGLTVKYADNRFALIQSENASLKAKVAALILDDVRMRLDPKYKKDCDSRLIIINDREGAPIDKGFCAVEKVDAFFRGVQRSNALVLLTINKNLVNGEMVTLAGIENKLFKANGSDSFDDVEITESSGKLPCIQISVVS